MSSLNYKYTGSCLCGSIQFAVTEFEPMIGHCHCTMCQKFHGAAFSTFGEVKSKNLHWFKGKEKLKDYKASNQSVRSFCDHCGSSLLFCSHFNRQAGTVELALSLLDQNNDSQRLQPDAHIYTGSKAPWLKIVDDLPQYQEYRKAKK